jgi:hypothetical protein
MAIQPFIRTQDRLTNKNFIDAEQWDFEFNKIADYLNDKILPALNSLFDLQVLASQIPADIDGYLYEDAIGSLIWKKPEDAGLLLNLVEPSIYNISFIGQKAGENYLSYLQTSYSSDGLVFCKNAAGFEIKKIGNNNLSNDIFNDSNFADDSIMQTKLYDYNDLTIIKPSEAIANFLNKNFKVVDSKLSFNCIQNGALKSQAKFTGNYTDYILNTHCRLLPEGVFGANGRWQLTEYKVFLLGYGYRQVGDFKISRGYNANFDTCNYLPTISQALYDETDYARNEIFKDRAFCLLSLTIYAPLGDWRSPNAGATTTDKDYLFKMNIPARCFADKSVGIYGSHYDYICFWGGDTKYVGCFPQSNQYDYSVEPKYNIDNLLAADVTFDYVEDDIIDIDFFPKRIQDKINARP